MRKLIAFVLLVMVALNVTVLVSAKPKECGQTDRKCANATMQKPAMNTASDAGLFPGLLKLWFAV